jgi:hypothetical protein
MKKLFYSVCCSLLFVGLAFAQNAITIKNNQVWLNGKNILHYSKVETNELSFYNLQNEEVLVYFIKDKSTKTDPYNSYVIINFLQERIKITCDFTERLMTTFGLNREKSAERLLNWLYSEKVFNPDGTVNREKAEAFQWKYNDDLIMRSRQANQD